jgi:hypothetical protein
LQCRGCSRRIWFWQARYSLHDGRSILDFHGECAVDWVLGLLNMWLSNARRDPFKKVPRW